MFQLLSYVSLVTDTDHMQRRSEVQAEVCALKNGNKNCKMSKLWLRRSCNFHLRSNDYWVDCNE